ncbi:cellulose biosynthesis cyclic di-GMP-binding regulatory protein BcsB, partial [Achromobacter sp.]|uniref:cellulose biosynthesis cyclic di-GMP-binding regulatory protein BcsB n=1 Tax=Achromobacter sp. TaxID=134375 RepID=UPI0031D76386
FGTAASGPVLEAAGVVSSWFGALADYRGATFPVSGADLPTGHAVVFVTPDSSIPGLTLPAIRGPVIAIVDNPRDPNGKLLLVMGSTPADLRTAAGEQLTRQLDDGTRLVLNSGSAVDLRYGSSERRLVLVAGEVLVTTGQEPLPTYRPFVVQTPQGEVQALGTRFSVRVVEDQTEVMVFEHAVLARPIHGTPLRIDAGQRGSFTLAQTGALAPVDDSAALWEQGMLVVRDQRLADVVAELARHRPGFLRCAPEVADLRVSGALSLRDTDAALQALAERLPIAVQRVTRYWVSVGPAGT